MAGIIMKLAVTSSGGTIGTNVNFSPANGYEIPNVYNEKEVFSLSGKKFLYKFGSYKRWEIPLQHIAKATAVQINTWRANNTELHLYPEYTSNPSTVYHVRIVNDTDPLSSMTGKGWDNFYNGKLILEGVL